MVSHVKVRHWHWVQLFQTGWMFTEMKGMEAFDHWFSLRVLRLVPRLSLWCKPVPRDESLSRCSVQKYIDPPGTYVDCWTCHDGSETPVVARNLSKTSDWDGHCKGDVDDRIAEHSNGNLWYSTTSMILLPSNASDCGSMGLGDNCDRLSGQYSLRIRLWRYCFRIHGSLPWLKFVRRGLVIDSWLCFGKLARLEV
jgi:hypothetical protein